MINFGAVPAGSVLPIFFDSFAGSTGASITITGLAVTDIEIYKGTSMTQRSSDAGYTLLDTDGIDLDGITGIQGFSVDTGDNTDASFYAAGSFYTVVVSAITVDSQTVNFIAATFRIVAAENTAGTPVADTVRIVGNSTNATNLGTAASNYSATRGLAGTALPAAAADAAGGLPISDAGGLDLDAKLANTNEITAARMGALTDWIDGGRLDLILDIIAADTTTDIPATLTTIAAYLDTEVAAIKAKTDNLPAAPAATGDCLTAAGVRAAVGLATANLDTQLDALPTAAENQSGMATAAALATVAGYIDTEIGTLIAAVAALNNLSEANVRTALGMASANLDTQLGDLPTNAELATALGTADDATLAQLVLVRAKTDSLTFTEAGKIDANLLSIGTDTAAAAAFKRAVLGNTIGTIGAASTTTSLVTSSLTPAASVTDQFKGRILTFAQDTTTAALRGQATDITASTAGGVLTVTALTTAPVSGDTFAIT